MTRDEAILAGKLAAAMEETAEMLAWLRNTNRDELGLDVSWSHSDDGSEGRDGPVVPRELVMHAFQLLEEMLHSKLEALGVES